MISVTASERVLIELHHCSRNPAFTIVLTDDFDVDQPLQSSIPPPCHLALVEAAIINAGVSYSERVQLAPRGVEGSDSRVWTISYVVESQDFGNWVENPKPGDLKRINPCVIKLFALGKLIFERVFKN